MNKDQEVKEVKDVKIVRTESAGVFFGEIISRKDQIAGMSVVMKNAIRIWYWDGAASLSQLAMEGTVKPENCKFAMPVNNLELFNVIEILDVTDKAKDCIEGIKSWKI